MLDINGIDVCRQIRNFISCPILFLTARIEDSDKIKGFGIGGDDYIYVYQSYFLKFQRYHLIHLFLNQH